MRLITRSIYGSALQTARHLGIEHPIINNSSLNQALSNFTVGGQAAIVTSFNPTIPVYDPATETEKLKLQYFCIGNGGHKNFTGADGTPYAAPLPHRATDAGPYKWLPFVMRLPSNDLPAGAQGQGKYRMRRVITVGGQQYIAYFLKALDLTGVSAEMQQVNVVNGIAQTPQPFAPTTTNLQPTPPNITAPGVFPNAGSYLTTTAAMEIAFTAAEIEELKNVVTILQGDELYAIISEIGLCSGVDKAANGYVNSGSWSGSPTLNYTEAAAVQINTHVSSYYPVAFTNDGFTFRMDAGATEPLFGTAV